MQSVKVPNHELAVRWCVCVCVCVCCAALKGPGSGKVLIGGRIYRLTEAMLGEIPNLALRAVHALVRMCSLAHTVGRGAGGLVVKVAALRACPSSSVLDAQSRKH
jgi:hypothetical protein